MSHASLATSFITEGRVQMAVRLADAIAAEEPEASAYDCAERAVRKLFGRWLLDHTAAIRPGLLPHYIRLVDRVEQQLGLHRRRAGPVTPSKPGMAAVAAAGAVQSDLSRHLAAGAA